MKRSLPAIALKRPITVIMLVITVMGLGWIAYTKIPLEFIPRIDLPFIRCYIPYMGATPAQVENDVAIPAEGEFRTVSQLKRITTRSDMNGCDVTMMFEWNSDLNAATADLRDRIERLKLILPDEIERLFIRKFSSSSLPIMAFALGRKGDAEEFTHLVRTVLQPRLTRIDGVADVSVFGTPQKEVLIEFDQNRLRSRHLSLYQVVTALQTSSVNVSVGELEDGHTKYFVRASDEFTTPEELAQLVVGPDALRLRDVADVGYRSRERETHFAIDGNTGTFILIRKESESNTINTCAAVHEVLDGLKEDLLFKDTDRFMFMDQGELITNALDGLKLAGKYGGSLALLVLFLFLRRVRPTIMVALAIPSSLVVSLVFMFFAGMTLNIVTMISMIIAVGMLVDNSIVVMENIYRYNEMGYAPAESAKRGASEVGLAITAATLTTVVVFIPILYLESGEMSNYMKLFAAPVTVALAASLVIALTVMPLAASHMRPRNELWAARKMNVLATTPGRHMWIVNLAIGGWKFCKAVANAMRGRFSGAHQWCLAWAIHWRLATVGVLAIVGIVTIAVPMRMMKRQSEPTVDTREVELDIELDQNFDPDQLEGFFEMVGGVIDDQREELGIKNVFNHYSKTGGSFYIYLDTDDDLPPGAEFPFTTKEVREILWQRMPTNTPGAEFQFSIAEASEGSKLGFAVRMRGDDADVLNTYADRFRELLAQIDNVREVKADVEREEQEVQIKINDTLAEQAGVSPFVIARTVDFALRGTRLTYLKQSGREIPVWAQFREEDRKTKANLDNVGILTQTGELVPVNRLVDYGKAKSAKSINRVDGKNVVTVLAKTYSADLSGVMRDLRLLIDQFEMPAGYTVQLGDELLDMESDMSNFVTALVMAVILIYLVMGALFESYLLPLSILTTVPLAGIGVLWAMYLTGTAVDTIALIGSILMVGIIVNNGIVIVDHVNQLRRGGMERRRAILQAGRDRFRPVMMTASTTILGCVPLAVGGKMAGEVEFGSLGVALIGGLTVGTLLTLFIVPVFYTLIDDFRMWFRDFFSSLARSLTAGIAKG
ncbi:MAG: efflux RND transporter permease subunit [bacterium]|nr:efflux RND transporter permease subunit [bacterium]